jgi:hypothetical protein
LAYDHLVRLVRLVRLVQRPGFLLGLLVLVGSGFGGGAASKEMNRVAGKATLHTSVCGGGAAIRREDVERLPPPQPIGGREFLVVAGEQISAARPAARFTTRADGTFVTRLPSGTWCFFDAARRPSAADGSAPTAPARAQPVTAPAPQTDAGCLAAERHRCDLVLAVRSHVSRAEIIFTARCPEVWNQPCYRGPMPP